MPPIGTQIYRRSSLPLLPWKGKVKVTSKGNGDTSDDSTVRVFDSNRLEALLVRNGLSDTNKLTYPFYLQLTDKKYCLTAVPALADDKIIRNNVLKHLDITGKEDHSTNGIESLDELARFSQLAVVLAANNKIRSIDVRTSTLTQLNLSNNKLTTIPSLFLCKNLKVLNLDRNRIQVETCLSTKGDMHFRDESWSQLGGLLKLEELTLNDNLLDWDVVKYEEVEDALSYFYKAAEIFKNLKKLKALTLHNNPLALSCEGYMHVVKFYMARDINSKDGAGKVDLTQKQKENIKKILNIHEEATRRMDNEKDAATKIQRFLHNKVTVKNSAAAGASAQKVKEFHRPIQTICSQCSNSFREPRLLSCLHTFCTECIGQMIVGSKKLVIRCPTCSAETHLTKHGMNGIKLLPIDAVAANKTLSTKLSSVSKSDNERTCENCDDGSATTYCRTCKKVFCERCVRTTHVGNVFAEHIRVPIGERLKEVQSADKGHNSDLPKCSSHKSEDVAYFCLDCMKLVCRDCLQIDDHKGHIVRPVEESSQLVHEELLDQLKRLTDGKHGPRKTAADIDRRLFEIETSFQDAARALELKFSDIRLNLKRRKDVLIAQMREIKDAKTSRLREQQGKVDSSLYHINHTADVVHGVLSEATSVEMLQMYSVFEGRMRKLNTNMKPEDPCEDVQFSVDLADDGELDLAISTFGRVDHTEP